MSDHHMEVKADHEFEIWFHYSGQPRAMKNQSFDLWNVARRTERQSISDMVRLRADYLRQAKLIPFSEAIHIAFEEIVQ